jgi:hypothetical protein
MNFSFGICCCEENKPLQKTIIESIRKLNIPNYEIILVGNTQYKVDEIIEGKDLKYILFDESIKPGWITKKKNIITEHSRYENIVYAHDYIKFNEDWYNGYLNHENFKISMNRIHNLDGKRSIDWLIYYQDLCFPNAEQLLPYDLEFSKIMYIPGFYWVAKKEVMQKFPLNENLIWSQAEDIEWSRRIREKYKFSMNPESTVQFLKQKDYTLNVLSQENIDKTKEFYGIYYATTPN